MCSERNVVFYTSDADNLVSSNSDWTIKLNSITKVFHLGSDNNSTYSLVIAQQQPRILIEKEGQARCPPS